MEIISVDGWYLLLRWSHLLAGVTWIGLLYYFNFVQGEWFKETDASAKTAAVQKLVPRALWWFRWSAMFTFLRNFDLDFQRYERVGDLCDILGNSDSYRSYSWNFNVFECVDDHLASAASCNCFYKSGC